MCGIAGIVGLPFDQITENAMLETMKRRGPDATGIYQTNNCCLLHSRLAVIDLAGGGQPMQLEWAGDTYIIVYNGELYNTEEIRKTLIALGHRFITRSDTEVILHAYAQWSEQCLEWFNGIFAFAVLEKKKKKLFLARDRMGVKPLFYKLHNGGLIFASEIKTILRYPTVKAELDSEGVFQLLMVGPGRIPGSGVLRGFKELEPGCFGYFASNKWNWKRYWKLRDREHRDSFEQTADTTRFLVTDAIRRQMVSDVQIGTFLSGGLDSSLISSVCAGDMKIQGKNLKTFSVEYENNDVYFTPGKFQPSSDNDYIRIMTDYLDTEHSLTTIQPADLADALYASVDARDLPGMADVDSSLLLFCKQIRSKVKVALSGECADEIFGGYPWYRDPDVRNVNGFPWAQNTKQRASFLRKDIALDGEPSEFVNDLYLDAMSRCDILPENSPQERRMKEMVNLNQNWFMQTLLDRKDRMSMYHGLEVRVPFCDYRIAEYLYAVPWEYKDYNNQEKGLLRYAMRGYLPDAVLYRKKSPYPKTYDPKYLELVSKRLRVILDDDQAPILSLVDKNALIGLLDSEYAWPWYGQLMKVPQTIAYMLQLNYFLEKFQVNILV